MGSAHECVDFQRIPTFARLELHHFYKLSSGLIGLLADPKKKLLGIETSRREHVRALFSLKNEEEQQESTAINFNNLFLGDVLLDKGKKRKEMID